MTSLRVDSPYTNPAIKNPTYPTVVNHRILEMTMEQRRTTNMKTVPALSAAKAYIENSMCFHESTHRGGAIWTICDDCGQKWADDRGGFQKPKMPKAYLLIIEALRELEETGE